MHTVEWCDKKGVDFDQGLKYFFKLLEKITKIEISAKGAHLSIFLSNDDLFLNDGQNGFEARKSLFVYISLWSIHLLPTQCF